ncbi:MAG: hypothetical protein ACD_50C00377G0005 [uncultured bacterium]|nr:MAG: hypothetical protein ACD_50C00377G0005 [uncultured bacterium]OGH14007.1 MAG: hypothetical protein A2687_06090 [Candidatus Levybacteria bacterium RIFCSPHIGHO2_01_FULL_38_26]
MPYGTGFFGKNFVRVDFVLLTQPIFEFIIGGKMKENRESNVHRIRNALAVIKAYGQILAKRLGKSKDKNSLSYLAKIDKEVNKVAKLIRKR